MKKQLTILLVEDELELREATSLALSTMYDLVIPACNGVEAMKLLKEHDIDLVITDLHMPDMCGVDLIEKIRSLSADEQLPIVIASGYNDISEKYLNTPCMAVIGKPVDVRELVNTINRLIEADKEICKTRENLDRIGSIYDEAKKLMDILKASK